MSARLTLRDLTRRWPDGTLGIDLSGQSLVFEPGEMTAILGPSGAGKSTLLRCASRLIEPSTGEVTLGELALTCLKGRALSRARGQIGFVFQQFNLVRSYSALDNVLVARARHVSWARGLLGLWREVDVALARRCLDEVGLAEKHQSLARELSGGQQQRVAVARAFAQEPQAIFADEPTASLDPQLSATVLGLLRRYGQRESVPVLINVHTIEHARRYCDRVIGMRAGRVVFDGPSSTLSDAAVNEIYGRQAEEGAAL
ncbi:MAG: phosphonate ABC transporter ATP-binding protein [Myxococcales bacterium]|nr:phosphonate ABC transporter ATP-binding protein [Myxococcales bacterium]